MPGKIRSKAQWRRLAATLPEDQFRELAEGVDYAKLPKRLPHCPPGGKTPRSHAHKPTGRTRGPRPR